MRLKQSEFFSGEQEEVEEVDDDEFAENEDGIQRIDLAKQQTKEQEDQGMVEMDDLDLLEATIDPLDF